MSNSKIEDNQLKLPNKTIITFNEQQYEAINKIRDWLKYSDKNDNFYTLSGFAGTGKTTVVKKILDEYHGKICVSAPTHKAKKVIVNTTNQEGLTLQSLLGLRPDVSLENFNPNIPIFSQIVVPKITTYNLIVIDEASMINNELYDMIYSEIKGNHIKVLFMGDSAQIPPVNERESPVFTKNLKYTYTLTKLERQNEYNPLINIYDIIRSNIDSPYKEYEDKTIINTNNEGVIFLNDNNQFKEMLIESFRSEDFKNDLDYCRVLAWTNKTVEFTNKFVRNKLFGDNAEVIEVGDVIMGYRSIRKDKFSNSIENSADYEVIEKGSRFNNKYGLYGWYVKVKERLPRKNNKYESIFIVDLSDNKNLYNYAEEHDKLIYLAKKNNKLWTTYYQFRADNIIMKNIECFRDGNIRNKDEIIAKDIDYGYCLTVHKAQGSTYKDVFILDDDINKNYNIIERNRIKYVAFTRPKRKAIVFNNNKI